MADYQVSIKVEGASELAERLRKFGTSILDLSSSMSQTGDYLTGFFSGEVFASQGRAISHPWPRLNEAYAARKAREWGKPPLFRTGVMNRSFKKNAGKLSVSISNEAWYFRFHQLGEGVPQRVMMDLDTQRVHKVVGFIEGDIDQQMRAANV